MMSPPSSGGVSNQKPVCSICYEDLKPIVEELQSIPTCGHVFHELCLQQWLEYCKKPTCPVCKQSCSAHALTRLYFQSTGDPQHVSSSQRHSSEHDAESLADEVGRLEVKLSTLTSTFENQQGHLKELNEEVSLWKDSAKQAEAVKEEIKREKECIERFLQLKLEELSRKSAECLRLEERSLAMAKELAALKLVTDLNLGEDEMVKLASIGHGATKDTAVDVLKRSLALRNKSYKELMAQCNLLGRAETRTHKQLNKAEEKIKKLKMRLQQLEKALEDKENGVLRYLKGSNSIKPDGFGIYGVKQKFSSPRMTNRLPKIQTGNSEVGLACKNQTKSASNHADYPRRGLDNTQVQSDDGILTANDLDTDSWFLADDIWEISPNSFEDSAPLPDCQDQCEVSEDSEAAQLVSCLHSTEASTCPKFSPAEGSLNSSISMHNYNGDAAEIVSEKNVMSMSNSAWDEEKLASNRLSKNICSIAVKMDAQAYKSASYSGNSSFRGSFRMESANRNAGKWCRQAPTNASLSLRKQQQASASNGDLIAVGADGRGGRVKVLRARDQPSGGKMQALLPKRCKNGAKQNGQYQIENFFTKTPG